MAPCCAWLHVALATTPQRHPGYSAGSHAGGWTSPKSQSHRSRKRPQETRFVGESNRDGARSSFRPTGPPRKGSRDERADSHSGQPALLLRKAHVRIGWPHSSRPHSSRLRLDGLSPCLSKLRHEHKYARNTRSKVNAPYLYIAECKAHMFRSSFVWMGLEISEELVRFPEDTALDATGFCVIARTATTTRLLAMGMRHVDEAQQRPLTRQIV